MSNRILIPYNFTILETSIIAQYFSSHSDWTKPVFDPIKVNIISHLRTQQNNRCCYCKYQLGFDIKQVDIEHIVPKSEYEIFTFKAINLALSCPACNTKKSTKPVLNSSIVNYPLNGTNFKIIHAHYDDYSNHIDIFNDCVFVAKTSKGSETITFCELFRLSTVEQRAKAYQKTSPTYLEQLVGDLKNGNPQIKKELIDIIKDAIR
ncbi:HNH endonuclease [Flavobacterium acetivorans]|uniref:HNH endonuclease n=1 Tax=Flavobacterium acetivorans TaxID=2893883 RepID=UPI001E52E7F2|nr:HNH endonuclease [Flavobacterium sp. F-29]UFH34919.1 HNH endonuclease [Flavobacterium sp. F-29]